MDISGVPSTLPFGPLTFIVPTAPVTTTSTQGLVVSVPLKLDSDGPLSSTTGSATGRRARATRWPASRAPTIPGEVRPPRRCRGRPPRRWCRGGDVGGRLLRPERRKQCRDPRRSGPRGRLDRGRERYPLTSARTLTFGRGAQTPATLLALMRPGCGSKVLRGCVRPGFSCARFARWVAAQPVKRRICSSMSGYAAINCSMSPCSTSGGSTPGHSVLASSA